MRNRFMASLSLLLAAILLISGSLAAQEDVIEIITKRIDLRRRQKTDLAGMNSWNQHLFPYRLPCWLAAISTLCYKCRQVH